MKKYISKILKKWGFIHRDEFYKEIKHMEMSVASISTRLLDVENTTNEFESSFLGAFEANYRLKKLEEYLGVEHKVEGATFIGYKQK